MRFLCWLRNPTPPFLSLTHNNNTTQQNNPKKKNKKKIVEQGDHASLVARRGIYWSLVRRQQKGLAPGDQDLSPMHPPLMSCERGWGG